MVFLLSYRSHGLVRLTWVVVVIMILGQAYAEPDNGNYNSTHSSRP